MGLDFVELIISIEDAFDIAIEDEQASKVVTVNDCYKLILNKIGKREVRSWSDEQVWEAMKNIIVSELGVKPEEVVPSAEFIKDLRID